MKIFIRGGKKIGRKVFRLGIKEKLPEEWREADYGIKRLQGMINFMMSEDWSRRIPEFQEYIILNDQVRRTNFRNTFFEMAELL